MSRIPLTLIASALLAFPAQAADAPMSVERVDLLPKAGQTDFVIHTSQAPRFRSFARQSPAVLIVDLVDATCDPGPLPLPGAPFVSAKIENADQGGQKIARLTYTFSAAVRYDVTAQGRTVKVSVFDDKARADKRATLDAVTKKDGPKVAARDTRKDVVSDVPSPRLAQGEGGEGEGSAGASTADGDTAGTAMTYIGFNNTQEFSRVFMRMNTKDAAYEVLKEGENLMVIEVKNATIPLRNNKNHLDATFFNSAVKMITPTEVDGETQTIRVIVEMKENVPYEDKREGNDIVLYFKK